MIQQNLTYYVSSSTAVLSDKNKIERIFYNVSLNETSSFFQSGSVYSSIRLLVLTSGSKEIAKFPWEQTNLYIESSSINYLTYPNNNIKIQYDVSLLQAQPSSSYYFKIINSSSLAEELNIILPPPFIKLKGKVMVSGSKHNFELYSGNNKFNTIKLYDSSSNLINTVSWVGTSSYSSSLETTGSNYYIVSASVQNTLYPPQLTFINNSDQPTSLIFNYSTGSGVRASYVYLESSTDQTSWSLINTITGSNPILSGSYPVDVSFYRIRTYFSGNLGEIYNGTIGEFYSDYSNVLGYTP